MVIIIANSTCTLETVGLRILEPSVVSWFRAVLKSQIQEHIVCQVLVDRSSFVLAVV